MVNQDGGHRLLPDQSLMCEARHGVVIAMDSEFARVNILTDLLRFVLHRTADEMGVMFVKCPVHAIFGEAQTLRRRASKFLREPS